MATRTIEPGGTIAMPAEAYRLTTPPGTSIDLAGVALQSLDASVATMDRSAVGRLHGKRATLRFSAVATAITRTLEANWSSFGAAIAGKVEGRFLAAQWLIGGVVNVDTIYAVVVVSPRVTGNIRAVMGFRGALGLGLGLGISSVVARWVRDRTRRA